MQFIGLWDVLRPAHFTFHSLRRSCASFVLNAHIPIQAIQQQETKTSDSI